LIKFILAVLALIVFGLSFWADHKWRQWMKMRNLHLDRGRPNNLPPDSHRR